MRFFDTRGRQSEQISQVHSAMCVADKPIQPADLHGHMVLVSVRARLQLPRINQVAAALLSEQGEQMDREARRAHTQDGEGGQEPSQALLGEVSRAGRHLHDPHDRQQHERLRGHRPHTAAVVSACRVIRQHVSE